MSDVQRAVEEILVVGEEALRGSEGATDRAVDLLVRYRKAILEEASAPALSRTEAVELAIKHVEKLATNARGYQDQNGSLAAKTQAVEAFVRLLLGEPSSSRE